VLAALAKALAQYDKVQAALNEFDSLSMSTEVTFTMNLGVPMGLRLDDDTLVVLSVDEGGQAYQQGVPVGARILAVGGETVTIVEDAIGALKRLRDAGNLECAVVYREFMTEDQAQEVESKEAHVAPHAAAVGGGRASSPEAPGGPPPLPAPPSAHSGKPVVAAAAADDDGQVGLPGMNYDLAELPGMAAFSADDAAVASPASPEEAGKAKRRQSMGPGGGNRRASHASTQAILNEKREHTAVKECSEEELKRLVDLLTDADSNDAKVGLLVDALDVQLFNAAQIVTLCKTTPSTKTWHRFCEVLIPRCTDPSVGGSAVVDMFRFTEDKQIVSEALKIRLSSLKAGMALVNSTGGAFKQASGATKGAAAAAVAVAGVAYSGVPGQKRRGSLGGGVGGSLGGNNPLSRNEAGLINNPLLRKAQGGSASGL